MTSKTEPAELLPCPFCGGEAELQEEYYFDQSLSGGHALCQTCGAKMPRHWPGRASKASTAWDTRRHPEPTADAVEDAARAIAFDRYAPDRHRWPKDKDDWAEDRQGRVCLSWDFANECRRQARAALSAMPAPSAEPVADAASRVDGYGASYRRDLDCWIIYSTPYCEGKYPEVCRIMGYEPKLVDDLLLKLRSPITTPQPTPAQVRADALREAAKIIHDCIWHGRDLLAAAVAVEALFGDAQ